jgi:hypothetical protein
MIDVVHTACKNCVFAQFESKTQTGCELGYIEKFKDHDTEILEVYDEELEFYVINHKRCLGYREESFYKSVGLENASLEEKKQYFIDHNHINYVLVIYLKNLESDLALIEKELARCKYKPQKLILIRYADDVNVFSFDVLNNFLKQTNLSSTPWRIQTMEDKDDTFENILHNVIALNKKNRFICYIKKSENQSYPINDLIGVANDKVYGMMGKFDILSNKDKTCAIFSAPSYRFSLTALRKDMFQEELCYTYI